MRRTLALIGLLLSPQDDLTQKLLTFERHHDLFIRRYYGCQLAVPLTPEVCKPFLGQFDYREFRSACVAAKDLYNLTGTCL